MFSIFYNNKQYAKNKSNSIVSKMNDNHSQEPEKKFLESNLQTVIFLFTIEKILSGTYII